MPDWITPFLTWSAWAPILPMSGLVTVAVWLLKKPYARWIETHISFRFDQKMESIKADLRAREAEIAALRNGALSGLTARHTDLECRKILAVETIWKAVIELGPIKSISYIAKAIDIDVALKEVAKKSSSSHQIKEFIESLIGSFKVDNVNYSTKPDECRPFIPQIAWASFSAYRQIVFYSLIKLNTIRFGYHGKSLADIDAMMEIVKSVLPHQTAFIDEYRGGSFPFLVDELEHHVLSTLSSVLNDGGYTESAVDHAAKINAAIEKVINSPKTDIPAELAPLARKIKK